MVAVVVLGRRVDVPRPGLRAVDAIKVAIPHGVGPIVLGNEGPISQLPGLILDLGRVCVQRKVGQGLVLEVRATVRKVLRRQSPQSPEDADVGQGPVDKVLIRAAQVVEDDPVEVARSGGEADVNVVCASGCDCGIDELEIVFAI